MIDDQRTLEIYGYTSDELSKGSHKPIVTVCDECGVYRDIEKRHSYRNLCLACKRKIDPSHLGCKHSTETKEMIRGKRLGTHLSDKTKDKLRVAHKGLQGGNKHPMYGKHPSKETLQKQSESMIGKNAGVNHPMYGKHLSAITKDKLSAANSGINHPQFGKKHSEKLRRKSSAARQGIPLSQWKGYVTENPYCEKFNESCRERNRDKYDRECFICSKPESENFTKTGKLRKLSVHHVDRNKDQGCNDHDWCLIPLCLKHHGCAHHEPWVSRVNYLLSM